MPAVRKVVVMRNEQPKTKTKFYTIEQIAECMNASTRSVRRWIEQKLLIAHRINGLVRISEADFAAFLAARRDD
jgi:excisionase family DNA binding protein